MHGFYRVAAATPEVRPADIEFNTTKIIELYLQAVAEDSAAVLFPELAITGYSCGDLFYQNYLHKATMEALSKLIATTKEHKTIMIVGLPWRVDSANFNVAAVIYQGQLLGVTVKSILPNYREFYEKRQFQPASIALTQSVEFEGKSVPFGANLLYDDGNGFSFGVEICEDLWCVVPPSSQQSLAGAVVIFNPSASTELIGKAEYRKDLIKQQSGRCLGAYVLTGAGCGESTSDVVYGGHALIATNGTLVAENERFDRNGSIIYADIDIEALRSARMSESSFNEQLAMGKECRKVAIPTVLECEKLQYITIPMRPFVPELALDRAARCREIFSIQCAGLAKRVEHTGSKTLVIGLSGGLDSTLALLVVVESCRLLNRPLSSILVVTMPGFGTTGRTRGNSEILCEELGLELKEINITAACKQHFADIGHPEDLLDVTFENTQARERTQILMDLANSHGGIVIGTGDLSEIALGWSTFNGDHMAMYSVNCSIPKTLIRYIIREYADRSGERLKGVLEDIIDTPVSPELLPPDESGKIQQKTEAVLGAYELHDFFLYHFMKSAASAEKLQFLAEYSFGDTYSKDEIKSSLAVFIRRFWSMQFKRNSSPDGPKVGSISLSPRGDWRMPADAVAPKF